jgi:putative phosphoribosyl transferase
VIWTVSTQTEPRMFADRMDAGRKLAAALEDQLPGDAVILALPRGGVPVAAVVARTVGAPLDVIVVRKVGLPYQLELGLGAVGENGVQVINEELLASTGLSKDEFEVLAERERAEVDGRASRLRAGLQSIEIRGRTAVLIDDGVATGSTMMAACLVARARGAVWVVAAVPVGAEGGLARIREVADEVVCLATPRAFDGVGQWYDDFRQTTDATVSELLHAANPTTHP